MQPKLDTFNNLLDNLKEFRESAIPNFEEDPDNFASSSYLAEFEDGVENEVGGWGPIDQVGTKLYEF